MNDLINRIARTTRGRIVVALSGGLDSTVLFHAAVQAIGRNGVVAAHVHHHLRSSADDDAEFCRSLASDHGVDFALRHVRPGHSNTQADSRSRRYAALGRVADAHDCVAIATGHHADDAIETFFERFSRGAGLAAVAGLAASTRIGRHTVVRPFLDVPRSRLEEASEANGLNHRDDPSNATDAYTRNTIRHRVVPSLQKEHGPAPMYRSLANIREEGALVAQAVDQLRMAAALPAPGRRTSRLERTWIDSANTTLRRRVLLETAADLGIRLGVAHFESLERRPDAPARVDLPGGHAVVSREHVTFIASPEVVEAAPTVVVPLGRDRSGALPWYDTVIIWGTGGDGAHLSLPEGATVRVRGPEPGDTIATEAGDQTVREVLRSAGVPAEDRWRWPCLEYESECIAVLGIRSTAREFGPTQVVFRIAKRARNAE